MTARTLLRTLALLLLATPAALAQPADTIVQNPKAVKLHKIWMVRGSTLGGDAVGDGAGGLGDIFGTGYGAWAVAFGKAAQVRIYAGGPDTLSTTAVRIFDSAGFVGGHPVVGDFWGNGHKVVGIYHGRLEGPTALSHYWLSLYRTDSNRLADTPAVVWDAWTTVDGNAKLFPEDILAADLDGDGADEMMVISSGSVRGTTNSDRGEVWIYRGGAQFQVDSPSVIIRDDEEHDVASYYGAVIANFDDTTHPTLLIGGRYGTTQKLKFFWSTDDPISSWSQPDRVLELTAGYPSIGSRLVTLDCDGDARSDLLLGGISLFRSSSGRNFRTRLFTIGDADQMFRRSGNIIQTQVGSLNDSRGRYQMAAVITDDASGARFGELFAFSGGMQGPDHAYDAHYDGVFDGLIEGSVFGIVAPLDDVNGDGWSDLLTSSASWYDGNQGIALILAGGPYIPRDSVSLGVHDVAIAGRSNGMSLWPNPVHEELNIAWRGDLKQMPTRFEVHDMSGRLVAVGDVEPWHGAALWCAAGVPGGAYMLSVFDGGGELIATAMIVRE
jgi:hypothetical protein